MRLLLINSFKGLTKKKVQMLGIILMVLLSTAIYVTMHTAVDRLENCYYNYLEEQNVENLAFDVVIDLEKDISLDELKYYKNHQLKNISLEEKKAIDYYEMSLITKQKLNPQMTYYITDILKRNEVDLVIGNKKLDQIKNKYDFTYEYKKSKMYHEKDVLIKIIPYSEEIKINKEFLYKGKLPVNDNEITILPGFAKDNNLNIGDKYKIGKKEYKIVGFTYASDYIYPMLDINNPIFDQSKNNIVFVNEKTYEETIGVKDNTYSLIFNYPIKRKFEMDLEAKDPITKLMENEKETMTYSPNTYIRLMRIGELQLQFANVEKFADYFLYLLLGISVFIIIIITKKRIEDERLQIGVLKSLGYSRFSIAGSYLVYPIIGSLIGGILGYLLGILIHYPLTTTYRSYYTIPLDNFTFNSDYLLISILLPTIFLSIMSYLIALVMLRKKPLQLLKEGSNLKVNLLSKIVTKITKHLPFDYRFKYSLASRSLGKLLIVSLTSFCTGLLIVLTLIGMNLFSNMIDSSFNGLKYDYLITLNSLDQKEKQINSDLILNQNLDLKQIKKVNGKIKKVEKSPVTLTGLDSKLNYFEILNKDKKNIDDNLVDENAIIANTTLKEVYELEIGDILILENNGRKIEYQVMGFCEEYMGLSGYVNRNSLSKKLGLKEYSYNQFASKDKKYKDFENLTKEEIDKYKNIVSIEKLRDNVYSQTDKMNGSIYIVIMFASIMALIIIAVIANIVVEENKKIISLMKVMGYENKKISKIVLNIYTPFVIISYLLSIPVMIGILKWIINLLMGDTQMVIPITLSPLLALIGLVGLLIAYYIAIALSRRVLNKIPLAVALKRE